MKKLIALIAFIGFISVQSVSAQTESKDKTVKPATEANVESADVKKDMKSCHSAEAKSCCKKNSKASCCAKKGEEKAEATEKEKVKGMKD